MRSGQHLTAVKGKSREGYRLVLADPIWHAQVCLVLRVVINEHVEPIAGKELQHKIHAQISDMQSQLHFGEAIGCRAKIVSVIEPKHFKLTPVAL